MCESTRGLPNWMRGYERTQEALGEQRESTEDQVYHESQKGVAEGGRAKGGRMGRKVERETIKHITS